MNQHYVPGIDAVIAAYEGYFGVPTALIPFKVASADASDLAIAVWLPEDPDGATFLCSAGLGAWPIGDGFRTELGIEIVGEVAPADRRKMAEAIVDIGTAPLKTGRPFIMGQTLGNVELPVFERCKFAMLMDWLATGGFAFPGLPDLALLRIVPLFENEAKWVETQPDRRRAYLDLYNSGMEPEDFDRAPVDMEKP